MLDPAQPLEYETGPLKGLGLTLKSFQQLAPVFREKDIAFVSSKVTRTSKLVTNHFWLVLSPPSKFSSYSIRDKAL